jgi:hypothetical protein
MLSVVSKVRRQAASSSVQFFVQTGVFSRSEPNRRPLNRVVSARIRSLSSSLGGRMAS